MLDVADDEEVTLPLGIGFAAGQLQDRLLQRIDVLKLVDENVGESVVQRLRNVGRFGDAMPGVSIDEQIECKAFQIGEVHDPESVLAVCVAGLKR